MNVLKEAIYDNECFEGRYLRIRKVLREAIYCNECFEGSYK